MDHHHDSATKVKSVVEVQAGSDSATKGAEVSTEWWSDLEWDATMDRLPMGVANRLKVVDRSLRASQHLMRMLMDDAIATDRAEAMEIPREGLSPFYRESLHVAAIELATRASETLDEIRSNEHGILGTARRKAA